MKKLILIIPLFIVLFASCSPSTYKLKPSERKIYESYLDYSKYALDGFLISPNNYPDKFESCGEIKITIYPAEKIVKGKTVYSSSDNTYTQEETLEKEKIEVDEMLKIIVDKAKSKGGDALVNFRFRSVYNEYYSEFQKRYIEYFTRYELEGFVIKRK